MYVDSCLRDDCFVVACLVCCFVSGLNVWFVVGVVCLVDCLLALVTTLFDCVIVD